MDSHGCAAAMLRHAAPAPSARCGSLTVLDRRCLARPSLDRGPCRETLEVCGP
jgi:hypothetical protein